MMSVFTLGRAEQHGSILLKPCFGDDMMTDDIYRVSEFVS